MLSGSNDVRVCAHVCVWQVHMLNDSFGHHGCCSSPSTLLVTGRTRLAALWDSCVSASHPAIGGAIELQVCAPASTFVGLQLKSSPLEGKYFTLSHLHVPNKIYLPHIYLDLYLWHLQWLLFKEILAREACRISQDILVLEGWPRIPICWQSREHRLAWND